MSFEISAADWDYGDRAITQAELLNLTFQMSPINWPLVAASQT